jgi:hypothetical protein
LAISLETATHLLHGIWCDAALSEEIKSATASACDKSSLPLRRGWTLGSAIRHPVRSNSCMICWYT